MPQAVLASELCEVRQCQTVETSASWSGRAAVSGRSHGETLLGTRATDAVVVPRPSDSERRLICGQLFRGRALYEIFTRCERRVEDDRRRALARAGGDECLLNGMLQALRDARLTINFNPVQLVQSLRPHLGSEWVNCFAFREKPGAPRGSNVGRAHMEEFALGLGELLGGNQPYAEFARDCQERSFQWTSRPCYAALDFLHGPKGGAPTYGSSFLVLHDRFKHVCSYSPVDTFAQRLGRDVNPNELSTFFHLEALIGNCQDDWLGYSCLGSLKKKASGKDVPIHRNYGHGGRNNYIDVQVYARILLHRDVKEIHLSYEDLLQMSDKQRQDVERNSADLNGKLGREFIIIDR